MMPTGLARRLAALGMGVAMAASMVTGSLASPAVASPGAKAASKPKVSATKPTVSPKDLSGKCPVKVTFSAKIKARLKGGSIKVSYRWLHGDGSKSKIKSVTLKGKGTKSVTVKEKATFAEDLKGWQALRILKPYKLTTKKRRFSVTCQGSVEIKPSKKISPPKKIKPPKKPAYAKAYVDVDDYTGKCTPSTKITAKGLIKVGHPTWVKYRWIHNGKKIVEYGAVKVVRDKRVSYTFTPKRSHKGWVMLDIVSPRYGGADRDAYTVRCKKPEPPVEATASVTAPDDYTGYCPPITRTFKATITVNRIGTDTAVRYRWVGSNGSEDFEGPIETLTFAQGDPLSKEVSHTVEVGESSLVRRQIKILSPNTVDSTTAQVRVQCEPLNIRIENLRVGYLLSTCGTPGYGPAVTITATISVNGPVRVEYEWEIDNAVHGIYTTPGSFEATGPGSVIVQHRLESSPLTASGVISARLRFTSHNASDHVLDFAPPPCPNPTPAT